MEDSDKTSSTPKDQSSSPEEQKPNFRDVTAADVSVNAEGEKIVSPDYLIKKSNKRSFSIVGIFTIIIVLLFLFVGISLMMNPN
jgi:hypothetical protein